MMTEAIFEAIAQTGVIVAIIVTAILIRWALEKNDKRSRLNRYKARPDPRDALARWYRTYGRNHG